jgi:hypothetical protein
MENNMSESDHDKIPQQVMENANKWKTDEEYPIEAVEAMPNHIILKLLNHHKLDAYNLYIENTELKKDKKRLDYLEKAHIALNKRYGTNYGWELIINHNVIRCIAGHSHPDDGLPGVDLNDAKGGYAKLSTCREAIDKVMKDAQ